MRSTVGSSLQAVTNDRSPAYLAQPARGLDAFAAAFEADIDQNNVGLVPHGKRARVAIARRERAYFEAEVRHCVFKVESNQDLVLDNEGTAAARRYSTHFHYLQVVPLSG
jgi:hypothetical protein